MPKKSSRRPVSITLLFSLACLTSVVASIESAWPWYLSVGLVGIGAFVGFAGDAVGSAWRINGIVLAGIVGLVLEALNVAGSLGSGLVTAALSIALGGFVRLLFVAGKQDETVEQEEGPTGGRGWLGTAYVLEFAFLVIVIAALLRFR